MRLRKNFGITKEKEKKNLEIKLSKKESAFIIFGVKKCIEHIFSGNIQANFSRL